MQKMYEDIEAYVDGSADVLLKTQMEIMFAKNLSLSVECELHKDLAEMMKKDDQLDAFKSTLLSLG